ncbi:MAG TPA: hypothetical protein VFA09_26905 [Ktedonobacteraceae bacterium]|jgi:hypothetical protein|nr:hypothetical protein [Ktedonobacteraceae bacterium]
MPRFAVYYIPQADDPFYLLGTQVLGYDVRAHQNVIPPSELKEVLGPGKQSWTMFCRPYGFHLTICEALDVDWATIPRVEQELADLLKCFDSSHLFVLDRRDDQPVGVWEEGASKILALLYEPNMSLRMLHTLLVARLTLLGTGSGFLKRYLTHPQKELPLHLVQQLRLFYSPRVFENWHPHFTLLNPYEGEEAPMIASRLAQLFQSYRRVIVPTICLLIQENNEANWQIYQEFRR